MTKEEILKNEIEKSDSFDRFFKKGVLKAMDIYALQEKEKEAIEFAKWLATKGYQKDHCEATTESLYSIYKQEGGEK